MAGKAVNKAELQKRLGLEEDPEVPLIGMVTRMVAHKGLDLVKETLDQLMWETNIQFVILGSGDYEYETLLPRDAEQIPRPAVRLLRLCAGAFPQDLRRRGHLPDAQQERALRPFADDRPALRHDPGGARHRRPEGFHSGQRRRRGQRLHVPELQRRGHARRPCTARWRAMPSRTAGRSLWSAP